MKTDREIAGEAYDWYCDSEPNTDTFDACMKAISLARQYGALPAPAAPLTFVEQAAIAAMQAFFTNGDPVAGFDDFARQCVKAALALDAALKKGGAE